MELWIRSQDKKKLYNVKSLELDNLETGICYESRDTFVLLGKYKSKERALEILDEIQNILKPKILLRRNDDNDKELLGALQKGVTSKIDIDFKELPTYVYEMPKE